MRDACAEALATLTPASALSTLVERGAAVSTDVLSRCARAAVAALGPGALVWVVQSGLSPFDAQEVRAALYALDPLETSKALHRGLTTADRLWVLGVSELVCAKGGTCPRSSRRSGSGIASGIGALPPLPSPWRSRW